MHYTFQDGPFPTIEPEAIKAQDGDTGINVALIYSISEGKYNRKIKLQIQLRQAKH